MEEAEVNNDADAYVCDAGDRAWAHFHSLPLGLFYLICNLTTQPGKDPILTR